MLTCGNVHKSLERGIENVKFDKTTAADEAMKNKAKKAATKAATKTAKKAGKAAKKATKLIARKVWMMLLAAFGGPGLMILLSVILLLLILPAMLFGSTMGVDNKSPDDMTINSVGSAWEDDAVAALDERYNQLTSMSFWGDLKTFFSTGSWGTSGETFKTEYANADDVDENGKSVSPGYFSASNRMITVINQTFIAAQDDATNNAGVFFQSPAMRKAANAARSLMDNHGTGSFYAAQRAKYPLVPDWNVISKISKNASVGSNFIYQACYIVAASSLRTMGDDAVDVGVRKILDGAFYITGMDNTLGDAQKICWTPTVIPKENYREEQKVIHEAGDPFDSDGDGMNDSFYPSTETVTEYFLELTYEYSIALSSDFKDIVNDYYFIEDVEPDAKSYDVSPKEQVNTNATELFKFYSGANVDLGVIGLPLPEYSYSVGHRFNCHCSVHNGHGGQDLPAANGTDVFTVAEGTISYVQSGRAHNTSASGMESYENCVFVTHPDGTETRYAHLEVVSVSQGDVVTAGDPIGKVGNTGFSFGNHLHFEMLNGGQRIDPMQTDVGALIDQYHS